MSAFRDVMLKAINDYKALLRKNLSARDCMAKLRKFGIKRKFLKESSDAGIYDAGKRIFEDVTIYISGDRDKSPNYHYGMEAYSRHLKRILDEYCIENNEVVSVRQRASRSLVDAIQLITLPDEKFDDTAASRLGECVRIITSCGNQEQVDILNRAIKQHEHRHDGFFSQLLELFKDVMPEFSTVS